MLIDNGVWYARIGIFNNLFIFRFASAKKSHNSSFNIFSKIKSLLIFTLPCLLFLLILTFLFSLVYIFLVLFLSNYENISSLPNRSNISLTPLSYYLTAYPGMLNNKHYLQMRLLHLGDVELNPGPNKSSSLSFLHWNINRIAAHDFSKLVLIQSHAASHNTDIIFLSETFLDSTTEVNDPKINIPGYNLLRCDHPSNLKRAGVCMFYKEYLPINRHDDLCTLTECIVTELNLGKKSVFFTLSYRSPSQTTDEF